MKNVTLESRFDVLEYQTSNFYFTVSKKFLKKLPLQRKYPEAISGVIQIEFPMNHIEPKYAVVDISPTKHIDYDDGVRYDVNYDWQNVVLPPNIIEDLISLIKTGEEYSVIGYDKDNDVFTCYEKFGILTKAMEKAEELTKQIEKGELKRKCSDGTEEPIDWIEVYRDWNGDDEQFIWSSYGN